jgi:23S rRNA pseudouridine1911/1915/1917 synthase
MITTETVPELMDGDRLDRVVAMMVGVTRSVAQDLVTGGSVVVNGKIVTSKTAKVTAGAVLDVTLVDEVEGAGALVPEPDVAFSVVYEDAQLAVIDKPAGLVVHPGSGNQTGTLVHGLLARFPELAPLAVGDRRDRPGIVHRLDRGTSGLLVVARTAEATDSLIGMMSRREVSRKYLALARGKMEADNGLVDAPIGRSDKDPTRMIVTTKGREARTSYRVIERHLVPEPCSYVECTLETGRTHQIRVHLAAIGHAICGDPRYGGKRGAIECPRPFLHAYRLAFTHPFSGEEMEFNSELPDDLVQVLASLE